MQKFSLEALGRQLLERAGAAGGGHSADTVVGGHERILRQTVIAMVKGAVLAEHENPGEATVHVLRGRVRLSAGDLSWEGRSGDLLVVPDARHSLEALEASAVLLTVAKRILIPQSTSSGAPEYRTEERGIGTSVNATQGGPGPLPGYANLPDAGAGRRRPAPESS